MVIEAELDRLADPDAILARNSSYDRYGHLIPGNENEAAALLNAYLERSNTQARLAALDDRPGDLDRPWRNRSVGGRSIRQARTQNNGLSLTPAD
jgi:hypothetical protein